MSQPMLNRSWILRSPNCLISAKPGRSPKGPMPDPWGKLLCLGNGGFFKPQNGAFRDLISLDPWGWFLPDLPGQKGRQRCKVLGEDGEVRFFDWGEFAKLSRKSENKNWAASKIPRKGCTEVNRVFEPPVDFLGLFGTICGRRRGKIDPGEWLVSWKPPLVVKGDSDPLWWYRTKLRINWGVWLLEHPFHFGQLYTPWPNSN